MLQRLLATAAATAFIAAAAPSLAQAPPPAAAPATPAAPAPATSTAAVASTPQVVAAGDLIATAKGSGQFTTLVKALDATNLTAVLQRTPNLTVFAPTDAAFAALPPGQLDELMKPANAATLQKILTYHVINARVDSTKIKGAKGDVKTVEGDSVLLDGSGDTLLVDGATILQSDVIATNGILHVVDKVLMPGDLPMGATAATSAAAPASTREAAVNPAGEPQATAQVNTTPPAAVAQPTTPTPGAPPSAPPVDRAPQ